MGLTPDMLRYVDVCVLFASLCADVCVRGAGRGVWHTGPERSRHADPVHQPRTTPVRPTDRQTHRQADPQTVRPTDSQTHRQADPQTSKTALKS